MLDPNLHYPTLGDTHAGTRMDAIYAEEDVPDDQRPFIRLNEELAKEWKPIVEVRPAPEDAGLWARVKDKLKLLER